MATYCNVNVDRRARHAYITLNRGPVNSIDIDLLEELETAFSELETDANCRVIVWRSGIDKFFSAGADIRLLQKLGPEEMDAFSKRLRILHLAMRQSRKLHIAAIAGHCLGGGLELALACDLRFARNGDYQIGLPEIRLGLMPGGGGTRLASEVIGAHKAFRLAALAEMLNVSEAKAWGLVDDILEPAKSYADTLEERAAALASRASYAIARVKRLAFLGSSAPIETAFSLEGEAMHDLRATDDSREGLAAFIEKRPPLFRGR